MFDGSFAFSRRDSFRRGGIRMEDHEWDRGTAYQVA